MRARVFALLLAAALACDGTDPAEPAPDPPDPVGRTTGFLRAVHAGDFERAWNYLSTAAQQAARSEGERQLRDAPYALADFAPLRICCIRYGSFELEPVKLLSQDGERAQVEVLYREATNFRLPGFSPREHRLVPQTVDLVNEAGEWRIAREPSRESERAWRESVHDGVAIRTKGVQQLWVLADLRAPLASVERTAMDWQRWSDWAPGLREVVQVGSESYESNPILGTSAVEPILRIGFAADPAAATFLLHRYDAKPERSTGFSGELRPRSESAKIPAVVFAVYPDPGGVTRLQLVFSRSPGLRASSALDLPEPEAIARFVRAFEHRAAATQ